MGWLGIDRAGLAAAVVTAALLASPAAGRAEGEPAGKFAREADKAAAIKRILAGRRFKVTDFVGEAGDDRFCSAFLEDFRAQRNITHVEPVARAELYGDRAFAPFRKRCPGLELNMRSMRLIGRAWKAEEEFLNSLSPEERELSIASNTDHYLGTRDFRMYKVDIDNNPANGEEHVFYSQDAYWLNGYLPTIRIEYIPRSVDWNDVIPPEVVPDRQRSHDGFFNVLDLSACQRRASILVDREVDHDSGKRRFVMSGILKYKDNTHIYEISYEYRLFREKKSGYLIDISNDWGKNMHLTCRFVNSSEKSAK